MTSENTNCLEGMKCPKCGSLEPFKIEISTLVKIFDDGTDDDLGNHSWGDNSYCECCECAYAATAGDFKADKPNRPLLPYSVLLLYPDSMTDGRRQTYFAHVEAANPSEAVHAARAKAAAAQEPDAIYDPADFALLICIAGH